MSCGWPAGPGPGIASGDAVMAYSGATMLLRTLGGLTLDGAALTRPKPLMVLAYLCLEGPTSRRELAELFFGDAADPRDSLSTTLRHLRHVGAVEDLADDHGAATVAADATLLLHDYDRFRYRTVLERYVGPFLSGVESGLGVDAEEWLFRTREAIAGRVRAAAFHEARAAVIEDRLDDARELTRTALRLRGVPELEADDLETALALVDELDLPEAAQLRALASGFGLELPPPRSDAARPRARGSLASLQRGTRFVGRSSELAKLGEWLADGAVRMVTLVGMGGVGKTRLALRFAERAAVDARRYPGGSLVVGLEAIDPDDDVVAVIATQLGLPATAATSAAALCEALARTPALLLLDNVEHVTGIAELVIALQRGCPDLDIVTTSRRRLRLADEQIMEIGGLVTQPSGTGWSEAAALFIERAARVGYPEEAVDRDRATIEALCTDLDGYPLGIELAASWTRLLSVEQIRATLREGLELLDDGPIDAPARHRAVQAALAPSLALLAARERLALQSLSVFRGSFAFDAANAVAGASLPLLARLVDHALVRSSGGGRGRFTLHPVMQAFVRANTPDALRERALLAHRGFYADLLRHSVAAAAGESVAVLDRLELDLPDVMQAARETLVSDAPLDGVAMLQALVVDLDILQARPTGRELITLIEQAAAVAEHHGAVRQAERLLVKLANAHRLLFDDVTRALALYERALALSEAGGDVHGQVMLQAILGAVGHAQDPEGARAHLDRARSLAEASGDDLLMCEVLQRQGYVATKSGAWPEAKTLNEHAIALARRLLAQAEGETSRVASLLFYSLCNLGAALDELGDIEASLLVRAEALAFAEGRGQRLWAGHAHQEIASGLADLGRLDEARPHASSAWQIYCAIGSLLDKRSLREQALGWGIVIQEDPAQAAGDSRPDHGARGTTDYDRAPDDPRKE